MKRNFNALLCMNSVILLFLLKLKAAVDCNVAKIVVGHKIISNNNNKCSSNTSANIK